MTNVTWYSVREKPFSIYGLYQPLEPGIFRRLPEDVAEKTSENVWMLSTNTSGGRIRFQTDSQTIHLKAIYSSKKLATPRAAALSTTGAFCFDLYADGEFAGIFIPDKIEECNPFTHFFIEDNTIESVISLKSRKIRKMRDIIIHMPCFADILEVYIGVEEHAEVRKGKVYGNEKPIVFYGSSITQGACVSRPGNMYQNILSQKLNFDYVNLGFSGSALAEDSIIDYISQMDMQMLVFDYDHNAPTPEYLEKTHYKALEKIRSVQKDIPIFILTRPNLSGGVEEVEIRRNIIYKSYETLCSNGDQNVYFVDGRKAFHSLNKNMMTIDGIHPNDFGFYCIAAQLEAAMRREGNDRNKNERE